MANEVFCKGKYRARLSQDAGDIRAAQALRYKAFRDPAGVGRDRDRFDEICRHVLIEDAATGALLACYRLLPLASGREIAASYAAQFYDLRRLSGYPGRMVEMGRFCTLPGLHEPEILRFAWAMMTRFVDGNGIEMMFGCSSFPGVAPGPHLPGFAMLKKRFLAPEKWRPGEKAPERFRFAREVDVAPSLRAVPPLLRSYLAMGGWVSDHAVIDRELETLHVFTGLEVRAVPRARARVLRAAAR